MLVLAAPVVLPLWVAFGHVLLLGETGLMMLVSMLLIAPTLFSFLTIPFVMVLINKRVRATRRVSVLVTIPILVLTGCVLVFPAFVREADDQARWRSFAQNSFGISGGASDDWANALYTVGAVALCALIVATIYEFVQAKRNPRSDTVV
ncbi:hypothetical protein EV193_103514 [Herbihabitans rhizosphaerae]|uniref:Uncharacterized protein n=1 Tax=Herbihabitans rhizosphaerae TaxID=1872711 RepID=A0A4Q7KWN8_9PSEU|nr:hypothetical protein EV193_103514 [Herbihabitans rhizosphaerae]